VPVAEAVLAKGQADAVVMTRALISDPELPRKAPSLQTNAEPIRPHIGNTRYFSVRGDWNRPLGDLANPRAGREAIFPPVTRAATTRRLLVVGAGPAGMEAAGTLARQGHTVTLAEREPVLGGWARLLAERLPVRAEYRLLVDYHARMLERLGITVELGRDVTGTEENLDSYDTVYLAVGAATPALPLAQNAPVPVLSGRMLLALNGAGLPPPGNGRVVVVDSEGGFRMGNTVEFLLAAGHAVDVVTPDFFVGRELVESGDFLWFPRVALKPDGRGAAFHPRTEALHWSGAHLICADRFSRQERPLGPVAFLVVTSPEVPKTRLLERLRGRHPHVVTIGDARAPRLMGEATLHAHRTVVGGGE
jgi:hypothetical protein